MLSSIVHIESSDKTNKSFGTGFVIDTDEQGAYILTCQHVLEDVQTAVIEEQALEVIATSDFLDTAVLYAKALDAPALPLQLEPCTKKEVHAIGFSSFSKDLVQKKEIHATLFNDTIELHSTKDDSYYIVRRLKAHEDYSFERGISGSPVLCKETGAVIAMISNKEGSDIAYAIEISSLKEICKELNSSLLTEGSLDGHQHFYDNITDFTSKVKDNFEEHQEDIKKNITRLSHMDVLQEEIDKLKKERKKDSKLKYYLSGIISVIVAFILYHFLTLAPSYEPENYKVINISKNDTLNIREGKGTVYATLGEIPYNAENIAVTTCMPNDAGKEWCNVSYGSIKGWVRSYYIEKEIEAMTNTNDNHYTKMKENNLFLQFNYPTSVKRGDNILLTALLKNNGATEDLGGITLSFPQRPLLNYKVAHNDFDTLTKYGISKEIYNHHENQAKKMPAIHPIIEATKLKWQTDEQHIFSLSMSTPQDLNVLRIRIRGSLTLNRLIPTEGKVDQQGFMSKEIVIKITD